MSSDSTTALLCARPCALICNLHSFGHCRPPPRGPLSYFQELAAKANAAIDASVGLDESDPGSSSAARAFDTSALDAGAASEPAESVGVPAPSIALIIPHGASELRACT